MTPEGNVIEVRAGSWPRDARPVGVMEIVGLVPIVNTTRVNTPFTAICPAVSPVVSVESVRVVAPANAAANELCTFGGVPCAAIIFTLGLPSNEVEEIAWIPLGRVTFVRFGLYANARAPIVVRVGISICVMLHPMNALSPTLVSAGHEVMDRFGLFVNALGPIEVVVAGRVILDRLQPLNTPSPIDVSGPNNGLLALFPLLFPILDKLLHPLNV